MDHRPSGQRAGTLQRFGSALLFLAIVASCSGEDQPSADPSGATSPGASGSQPAGGAVSPGPAEGSASGSGTAPDGSASPDPSAPPTPVPSTGDARAQLLVDAASYEFGGGRCLLSDERDTLSVQIGLPGADDYFGLTVNSYPDLLQPGFAYRTVMTVHAAGRTLPVHDVVVRLDGSLRGGEFEGAERETAVISGSFRC